MGYEFILVFPGHYESKNCKSITVDQYQIQDYCGWPNVELVL